MNESLPPWRRDIYRLCYCRPGTYHLPATSLPEEAECAVNAGNNFKIFHILQIRTMKAVRVSTITKSLRFILDTFTNAWRNRSSDPCLFPVIFSKERTTVVDKFFWTSYRSLNLSVTYLMHAREPGSAYKMATTFMVYVCVTTQTMCCKRFHPIYMLKYLTFVPD